MKFPIFNNLFKISFLALTFLTLFIASCKKDDDDHDHNEQELITTVNLLIQNATTGVSGIYSWKDLDGPGGAAPQIDRIRLPENGAFDLDMEVLDESKTPVEDISAEIKAEGEDHIFVFTPSDDNVVVVPLDTDINNQPIGLKARLTTTVVGTYTLRIQLKHQADKSNASTTGETDIDITFPLIVE
jgi:hypothetical protein